jgi:hypothetical protein
MLAVSYMLKFQIITFGIKATKNGLKDQGEKVITRNGVLHHTFKAACLSRNLLVDDIIWIRTLDETIQFQMPAELRRLFVTILSQNLITNPNELFNRYLFIYNNVHIFQTNFLTPLFDLLA